MSEIVLEVNAEKHKHSFMYREQKEGKYRNVKRGKKPLNVWNSSNILEKLQVKSSTVKNYEPIELRECFLSTGTQSSVFQFSIQR